MSVKITLEVAPFSLSPSLCHARGVADQRATLRMSELSSFTAHSMFQFLWAHPLPSHPLLPSLSFPLPSSLVVDRGAKSDWYHNSVISNWRKPRLTLSRVYQQAPIIYGFMVYRGRECFPVFHINGSLRLNQIYYNACLLISFLSSEINLRNGNFRQYKTTVYKTGNEKQIARDPLFSRNIVGKFLLIIK